MVWMEDVFVPRSRVFAGEPINRNRRHSLVCWLLWHHSYGWLAKAELTLGLGLALAEVMGLKDNPQTIEQLVELTVNIQTTRTCLTAAELDPETTASGHALPNQIHVAASGINTLRVRQRMGEILRGLPGSSLVNAPADTDFADPTMASELEDAFGGGGYTALQRAALLQLAWDQVSSGLDGREAVFELHASGGLEAWRRQLAAWFGSYNELANGVQEFIEVDMPPMDLSSLQEVPPPPRRMPLSKSEH
jgi:4-hydroxyphenylacetate 3-monooxygenase